MANGNGKVKPDIAKGALAGATAGIVGDRNYKAEEGFRDALRAAKDAGCTAAECHKIIGSAVANVVDRWGEAESEGKPADATPSTPTARGLTRALQKIGAKKGGAFIAGFASKVRKS